MPSSIKMIKATDVVGGETTAKIETYVSEDIYKVNAEPDESIGATKLQNAQKKARNLLEQAEEQRRQLLEDTQSEIETIKQQAYEQAYQSGLETGQQEGFQQGYADATQQAEIENKQEIEKIQLMQEEAYAEIENYKFEKKTELIELASQMAAKIVHKEIDSSDQGILDLAQPYFYQIDKDEEMVSITVHSSQREQVEEHLPKIERISPNTRFVVYGNPSIEKNGIIIESSKSVIDLQIKKQIAAMLQEFDEMERTVDA